MTPPYLHKFVGLSQECDMEPTAVKTIINTCLWGFGQVLSETIEIIYCKNIYLLHHIWNYFLPCTFYSSNQGQDDHLGKNVKMKQKERKKEEE